MDGSVNRKAIDFSNTTPECKKKMVRLIRPFLLFSMKDPVLIRTGRKVRMHIPPFYQKTTIMHSSAIWALIK